MTDFYPRLLRTVARVAVEPVVRAPWVSVLAWLDEFESWPAHERLAWQHEQLEGVLAAARADVPFYRELAGAGPLTLAGLPVVDKATIRRDEARFHSDGWERIPHVRKKTGGTSGDPWRYVLDTTAWAHARAALLWAWESTGWRYGQRYVLFGTPPSLSIGARSVSARLRRLVEREVVSTTGLDISPDVSLRRARAASAARAGLWYGYASVLAAAARAVLDDRATRADREWRRGLPRAVVTTAEQLQDDWRADITEAFGVAAIDQYGCNDGGVFALSCRAGRYHLAEHLSIVQICDGDRPLPPGVEGDVVVTNLHSRALPFLRYGVGDRAMQGADSCPCGRAGATLVRLAGRTWDRLVLVDRTLSPLAFYAVFKDTPNVARWQIVQFAPDRVRVRLEVRAGFAADEQSRVERYVRDRCGPQVAVELTTAERIETTAGGKHLAVVRQDGTAAAP